MRVAVLAKFVPAPQGTPGMGPDHLLVRTTSDASLDPGDEYAVEAALRVAETSGGEVTIVSMGPPEAMTAVRKAISMGADAGILVSDPALRGADVLTTAKVLAAALRRGGFDLVFAGVESTDGYTGTLPITVAEFLGVPGLTFARSVTVAEANVRVERQTEAGYDVIEAPMPAVVTITGSADAPRYPTLKGIMAAKQKPVEELSLADLGLSASDVAPTQRVVEVRDAPGRSGGEIVDSADAPRRIADLLSEAKVLP